MECGGGGVVGGGWVYRTTTGWEGRKKRGCGCGWDARCNRVSSAAVGPTDDRPRLGGRTCSQQQQQQQQR